MLNRLESEFGKEEMMQSGLRTLVSVTVIFKLPKATCEHRVEAHQSVFSSSLQTSHPIRVLPELVLDAAPNLDDFAVASHFSLSR